jgi:hypothetical protein
MKPCRFWCTHFLQVLLHTLDTVLPRELLQLQDVSFPFCAHINIMEADT